MQSIEAGLGQTVVMGRLEVVCPDLLRWTFDLYESYAPLAAILVGAAVQFVSAMTLVASLAKAHAERRLEVRLTNLAEPRLLIVDDLGYLPLEPDAAHLFFQLVSRRYLKGAM
jgi:DNA replication protein DnaC